MAIIQCDIRRGRSDDQKRRLAAGLTRVVCEVTAEPVERTFLVIRELPGFNFVDAGEHVAEQLGHVKGLEVRTVEAGQADGETDGTKLFSALSATLADVPPDRVAGGGGGMHADGRGLPRGIRASCPARR